MYNKVIKIDLSRPIEKKSSPEEDESFKQWCDDLINKEAIEVSQEILFMGNHNIPLDKINPTRPRLNISSGHPEPSVDQLIESMKELREKKRQRLLKETDSDASH